MEQHLVTQVLFALKDKIPSNKVLELKKLLDRAPNSAFNKISNIKFKSVTITYLLAAFLGGFGADRFYIGDIGLGVAKLLLGWATLGIWPLVDIFMTYKKCKEVNFNIILDILKSNSKKYC